MYNFCNYVCVLYFIYTYVLLSEINRLYKNCKFDKVDTKCIVHGSKDKNYSKTLDHTSVLACAIKTCRSVVLHVQFYYHFDKVG